MACDSSSSDRAGAWGRRGTARPKALPFLALLLVAAWMVGCGGAEPTRPLPQSSRTAAVPPSPTPPPTPTPALTSPPPATQVVLSPFWREKAAGLRWVAYSPPNADPNRGVESTLENIRQDLVVLREAGFAGLVTYSSAGVLGRDLPALAQSLGFGALIMGIWEPAAEEELAQAKAAAALEVVLGFCVGNEGLDKRYDRATLAAAMDDLRAATGKPVATTEEVDDYVDEEVLALGDWVFPNVHPYFHNQLDPELAVRWTQAAYDDFRRRTDRFVLFKEVGLPTAGDPGGVLSEATQAAYYGELAKVDVLFVYFEAFDQPWKTHLPVEPHWGLFRSDRSPKAAALRLMGVEPSVTPAPTPEPTPAPVFYIYQDADSPDNHYKPTGYMGDTGDIHLNEAFKENPYSGTTAIRVIYDARGAGPNECLYPGHCRWAGVYWQEPPNNWGTDEVWAGRGFDLSGYRRLTFWARADSEAMIEFKVGGINERYGDSLIYARGIHADLTREWRQFEIDLTGADLSHIIGGFVWATNWDINPDGVTFYLDEIRFEE